jgi:hypothetical protein
MQGNPGCFSKTRLFDNLPNNRSNVAIGDKSPNIKPNSRPSLDECFGLLATVENYFRVARDSPGTKGESRKSATQAHL